MEIRKAKAKDFEQVYFLIKELANYLKIPEKAITSPAQMKKNRAYFTCFVAADKERISGFAI